MEEIINENEELFQVPGFPNYFITKSGTVYSEKTCTRKKKELQISDSGYLTFLAWNGHGKPKLLFVHKILAEIFLGEAPFAQAVVRHLDGNKQNNKIENFAWGTKIEDVNDKQLHGTENIGERNGRSKLTNVQVKEIKERLQYGEPVGVLAIEFDVSQPCISDIKSGRNWAWLKVN